MDWEIHNVIEGILKEIIHDLIFFLAVVIFGIHSTLSPILISSPPAFIQNRVDKESYSQTKTNHV